MKFFSTSEVDVPVGNKIRPIRNLIERQINLLVNNKDYGKGIVDWGHIVICCNPSDAEVGWFKEIKKYIKSTGDLDLRLSIDYEKALKADEKALFELICLSILRGVDIAEDELKIESFDFKTYRNDLTELFKKEGWI